MRRVYLRGQANVLKRVLIHLGGFNLSLIMRRRFGKGTPRGWQGFSADALLMGLQFWIAILVRVAQESTSPQMLRSSPVVRVTIVVRFAAQLQNYFRHELLGKEKASESKSRGEFQSGTLKGPEREP